MYHIPEKIILYGTGLEGEKFYCRYRKDFEIVYCLDKRKRDKFHGLNVYQLEQMKDQIHKYYIVVSVGTIIYNEIKKALECCGLEEYKDFVHANAIGKRVAFIYGNCHMRALYTYLYSNYEFSKQYYLRIYSIMQDEAPTDDELRYCDVLITQDIKRDNYLGKASCDELIKRHTNGKNIIVPNVYGCNMFFPQTYYISGMNEDRKKSIERHLKGDAIGLELLPESSKETAYNFTHMMVGWGDAYIDAMHYKGVSIENIKKNILKKEIWSKTDIQKNFDVELDKIKKREKYCDFVISDVIENNYQKCKLFYDPSHPTGMITQMKGIRILNILGLKPDMDDFSDNRLGSVELPIYGCVRKALGLQYEQKILRRDCRWTLENRPENLEEYIANYIMWVWG